MFMFFVNFLLVGTFLYVVKRSAMHDGWLGLVLSCIVWSSLVLPAWSCPGLPCLVSGQVSGLVL